MYVYCIDIYIYIYIYIYIHTHTIIYTYDQVVVGHCRVPALRSGVKVPLVSEFGTYKTVTSGTRAWLAGEETFNVLSCSLFARERFIQRPQFSV